jgi:UDP-N-acetylmuramyl pentapeptide phosphotransferase/UDP-N-acetylglucosamine-1-phosphate transferase
MFILPVLVGVVLFAAWVILQAIPYGWLYLALPLEHPIWSITLSLLLLVLIGVLERFGLLRRLIDGRTTLIVLVAVFLMIFLPFPRLYAVDALRVMMYHDQLQLLERQLRTRGVTPAVAVIPLDGFGNLASGVAYDPTGEILLPPARRSPAWTANAVDADELSVSGIEVRHVVGGYYAWFHP